MCSPFGETGLADSYASLRINNGESKRTSTIKSLEPVWNEQLQLDCTRSDTLHVEVYDDDSMRHVKSAAFSQLQGKASVRIGDLTVGQHATKVLKLTGGPGTPSLVLTLFWRPKESASFSSHETLLRTSLSQMRHELALSRAQKASWENSSGYLRSYGVLAPEAARSQTLQGPAAAEVFPDAKHPADKPRRAGIIPVSEMVVRPDVAAAVAKAYGHKDFQIIAQSHSTGGVDVVVGPNRQAESYSQFQQRWKVSASTCAWPPIPTACAPRDMLVLACVSPRTQPLSSAVCPAALSQAVDAELAAHKVAASRGYPMAPDGCTLPSLFGGYKRRATRFF